MFSHLRRRSHPAVVEQIIREAVVLEQDFLCDALPVSLIGLNVVRSLPIVPPLSLA